MSDQPAGSRRPHRGDRSLRRQGEAMSDVQVTCVNKIPRDNPHEGITYLGGTQWRWTRQQVVDSIEDGSNTFFTVVGGKRANIGVVNGAHGKYVQTYAAGQWNNDLLALAACPLRH